MSGREGRSHVSEPVIPMSWRRSSRCGKGEEVGKLPRVMLRLAEFYDTEIKMMLRIISSLVEPLP